MAVVCTAVGKSHWWGFLHGNCTHNRLTVVRTGYLTAEGPGIGTPPEVG
jgi:hypothetical protein